MTLLNGELWGWAWRISALICFTWAFWKGGPVERSGAAIVLVGWIATQLVKPHGRPDDVSVAIVDIICFIASAVLALWSHKAWTLFFAACHLIAVSVHFAAALSNFGFDTIGWWSYSAALNIWGGWGLLASIGFGVWQHQRNAKLQARRQSSSVH